MQMPNYVNKTYYSNTMFIRNWLRILMLYTRWKFSNDYCESWRFMAGYVKTHKKKEVNINLEKQQLLSIKIIWNRKNMRY